MVCITRAGYSSYQTPSFPALRSRLSASPLLSLFASPPLSTTLHHPPLLSTALHRLRCPQEFGQLRLAFRVADFRKHQIISAHVRMLAALNNNILAHEDEAVFKFSQLPVAGGSQIYLGLPCTVTHAVTHGSPLYGLSHSMMERSDLEILVLLEAVDCSTSATLQ
ncbi:unnamed protein product, partial [Closterium sp. Yama58-4]